MTGLLRSGLSWLADPTTNLVGETARTVLTGLAARIVIGRTLEASGAIIVAGLMNCMALERTAGSLTGLRERRWSILTGLCARARGTAAAVAGLAEVVSTWSPLIGVKWRISSSMSRNLFARLARRAFRPAKRSSLLSSSVAVRGSSLTAALLLLVAVVAVLLLGVAYKLEVVVVLLLDHLDDPSRAGVVLVVVVLYLLLLPTLSSSSSSFSSRRPCFSLKSTFLATWSSAA